jgi:hypothetical protein
VLAMANPIDLTGQRFGKLVADKVVGSHRKGRVWRCTCDCGGTNDVPSERLRNGWTKSCGCRAVDHGRYLSSLRVTHGQSHKVPEYNIWAGMKARCSNPRSKSWRRYGGRGIRVCAEWANDFEAFLRDMGPRPSPAHSLDRMDYDGDYSPKNCRWATMLQQNNNRSSNRVIEAFGERLSSAEWEDRTGVRAAVIRDRIDSGWDIEEAVSRPVRRCVRGG